MRIRGGCGLQRGSGFRIGTAFRCVVSQETSLWLAESKKWYEMNILRSPSRPGIMDRSFQDYSVVCRPKVPILSSYVQQKGSVMAVEA